MKRNLTLLAVSALAVGLVAAGCGSSNDNSTSTSSLTKAEWIAKADAICQAGNQEINAAAHQQFPNNQKPSQADQQSFATGSVIPSVQKQLDQIKALGAPSGDETQVNAILDAVSADLDKVKSDPSLVTSNSGDPFADANKLATAYGLKVCGKGG
jgi:hypothetical protein